MAKRVKGHRANKPNDSFGTIDQDSLYKGKYREEVYKDDEDDEESEEAVEAQEAEQEEQVETPKAESFATKEKSEPDYKKRYDDLKRHYDTKLSEWQLEKDELITRLNTTPQKTDQAPPTDLDNFRHQYPDMYEAIEKISSTQSEARVRNLEQELETIKTREKDLEKQKAYQELLRAHPDFDELKQDEKFVEWLEGQPASISDGVYNNATDARWASRVIDLYKSDVGLSKKSSTSRKKKSDAAMAVSSASAKELSVSQGDKRIWKASEIGKMKPWEFEKVETELDAARAEGRIDYNS